MQIDTYKDYKDSEVPWFTSIPIHWEAEKIKFSFRDKGAAIKTGPFGSQLKSEDMKGSDVKIYNQRNVIQGDLSLGDEYIDLEKYEELKAFEVFDEDLLVTTRGTIGRCKLVPNGSEKGILHPCLMRIQFNSRRINYRYFEYLLEESKLLLIELALKSNSTTLEVIYSDTLKNIYAPIPLLIEQTQIAKFLDYKTTQIDRLIEKKKALIEKLNERRIAVITQAVTKGISPDAPMKDSEVDWLGKVPEHWHVKRLRFSIYSNPVKSEINGIERDDLVSFVPMDAVGEYGGIRLDFEKMLDDVYDGYTYFRDNDVVVAKITPCFENGKGALATDLTNGIAFGTTELHVMRPNDDCSSRWLFYLSISHVFREIGASEMYGAGGQKRVPEGFIKNLRTGMPAYDEQEAIADYLDSEVQKIDDMVAVNNKTIDKLNEYRIALITAAVTGKIDVRNIPTPEQGAA